MVEVVPFKGLLYNPEHTGPLDQVTAPPYDVISPEAQEALYEKNPYNVVRLILGKEYPEDTPENNRYTRSAQVFREWIDAKVLEREEASVFYVYSQEYSFGGTHRSRVGLFARVKLEDFGAGNICPHEFTLAKAKTDRAQLIKACRANFSPIFGLFSDPDQNVDRMLAEVTQTPPLAVIEDPEVTHRLWKLNDRDTIDAIAEAFEEKKVYIADGHHRYETALAYYKEHENDVPGSSHVMMFLTNLDAESMAIFPIHRVVKTPEPISTDTFLSRVDAYFKVEALPEDSDAASIQSTLDQSLKGPVVFCVYLGNKTFYRLELVNPDQVVLHLKPEEPEELKILGVAQLHFLILRYLLDIDTTHPEHQQYINYKVDIAQAIALVDSGKYNMAFFMNPTPIEQVRHLAESGIRLPQKATFFYPKLLSGLVINPFDP